MMKMPKFLLAAIPIALLILLNSVILYQHSRQVKAVLLNHQPDLLISPYGPLRFRFNKAVDADRVSALWYSQPAVEGEWQWLDPQTAVWRGTQPLSSGEVFSFGFSNGPATPRGDQLQARSWSASVRNPQIVFMGAVEEGFEIFSIEPSLPDEQQQLTQTGGKVFDFTVSKDGEAILFSVSNELDGTDLYLYERQTGEVRLLLECREQFCDQANISPDGTRAAFTMRQQGSGRFPRIWLIDLSGQNNTPLFEDQSSQGEAPLWSPDGSRLAYVQAEAEEIHLYSLASREIIPLTRNSGLQGSWSADSRYFFYQQIHAGELSYWHAIARHDLVESRTSLYACSCIDGSQNHFLYPLANPHSQVLALSLQPNLMLPVKEVWLYDAESRPIQAVVTDYTIVVTNYQWSPDGGQMLYRSLRFPVTSSIASLWLWDEQTGAQRVMESVLAFPQWLP